MLELRGLSLRYGAQSVLRDVDLRLRPGERLGLIGPSGAGKSSLLRLAAGLAQRVALARALALGPDLLMLDEPFSALDPALRRQLAANCREELVRSGAALLCISHDPEELLGLVDRCVLVRQGSVIAIEPDATGALSAVRLRALLLEAGAGP